MISTPPLYLYPLTPLMISHHQLHLTLPIHIHRYTMTVFYYPSHSFVTAMILALLPCNYYFSFSFSFFSFFFLYIYSLPCRHLSLWGCVGTYRYASVPTSRTQSTFTRHVTTQPCIYTVSHSFPLSLSCHPSYDTEVCSFSIHSIT